MKHSVTDWSKVQVGDVLSKNSGFRSPGSPVRVVRRTPKHIHLDDGVKLHIGGLCRDYEPWSDEREAKRARERDSHNALCRFQQIDLPIYSPLSAGRAGRLSAEDAIRDPAMIDELEALLKRQNAERVELILRVIAARPPVETT